MEYSLFLEWCRSDWVNGGRATVQALDLNQSTMLAMRAEKELQGRHPPPEDINPVDTDL
ncbi:hypothetical protein QUB33_16565 [Microcoleus sp. B3-A4]|uniref:hypothetical protein n=1 Tax=Microcoleus sp. B3-A4 TaxID=2818653 RepID=UPI002FD64B0C